MRRQNLKTNCSFVGAVRRLNGNNRHFLAMCGSGAEGWNKLANAMRLIQLASRICPCFHIAFKSLATAKAIQEIYNQRVPITHN